jgi:hypothetical protein
MSGGASDGSSFFSKLPPIALGALTGMDVPGETILGTYLYGGGAPHVVYDDPVWTPYMMANEGLRSQIYNRLVVAVKNLADNLSCRTQRTGRFPISVRFHGECPENSGFSGYALLHGTNSTVGDFLITGWADAGEPDTDGSFILTLTLRFVFNDIVDPNGNYAMDRIRAAVADIFTFGQPKSYRLSISWGASSFAEVGTNGSIFITGYPSTYIRGVRPLPVGTLDWVGENKKYAKQIELKIIQQLQRSFSSADIVGLADRKQRLLWLFYRLSGYMASIYISRLSSVTNRGDQLQRLVRERLSDGLQAELMDALRGKRPQGVEPA